LNRTRTGQVPIEAKRRVPNWARRFALSARVCPEQLFVAHLERFV
jgi:hypothetical protein